MSQEAHGDAIAELSRSTTAKLDEARQAVATALRTVDARVVFSTFSLYRLTGHLKSEGTPELRPAPAAIELAAWVCFPEFGKSLNREPDLVHQAVKLLDDHETVFQVVDLFGAKDAEGDPFDELDTHLRIHASLVRGSAYHQQIIRRIESISTPFEAEIVARYGIGPRRVCEMIQTIGEVMEQNITGMMAGIRAQLKDGEPLSREEAEAIRLEFARCERWWPPAKHQVLAKLADATEPEWRALEELVGLTAEKVESVACVVDIQDRPVFFIDSDRAFFAHAGAVLDAAFSNFDDYLRSDPAQRDRYGRVIADWMESEIEKYLRRMFPASRVIRSACFSDPDNPGGEAEADLLVVWGPIIVVIEAKGKRVPKQALRGSRHKLRQTIQKNIQDAFYQARRVARVLERDGQTKFKEKATGRVTLVRNADIRRLMPISVTLQHLSGISTQLAVTQRLGLFRGNAYPWSVSIDDLDVITRFAGSPDVFLHYLERRISHQSKGVRLRGDELDIFRQYFDNRLDPGIYEERGDFAANPGSAMLAFTGGSEDFDESMEQEDGEENGTTTPPELRVPAEIKAVLDELRGRYEDGARWVAFSLLGLNNRTLEKIATAIQQLRATPVAGQKMLRARFEENDLVINLMMHGGMSDEQFHREVTIRTRLEHYHSKANATMTLGINQRDNRTPLDVAQWQEGEWQYDPELERLVIEDAEQPRGLTIPKGQKKPGRNQPCPCGSGKKYKRCCQRNVQIRRTS